MAALKFHNTLTRQKEAFKPLDPKNVRLYVCGPTVYDFAHIGNARPAIVFDVLFRLLRHVYGEKHVTYVRNVTDVDDKINARAKERGVPIRQLTEETLTQYHADVRALGCLDPTHEPRATDYIAENETVSMIGLIKKLIERGHAYEAERHVLFDVPSMKNYGKLSGRSMDEMIAGARVDVAPFKKNPADFVLWKPSSPDLPGWDSPWGRGRPGWHIECSAMAAAFLGEEFDIHGGGIDLVFPHHENEIAQSCCAFGTKRMAQIWMHNGFLQMEGEKMSKSLGNFATIREVLNQGWSSAEIRLTMLKTHYRQPIDWSEKTLNESRMILGSWRHLLHNVTPSAPNLKFIESLSDDLNTPQAMAELHSLRNLAAHSHGRPYDAAAELAGSLNLLGLNDYVTEATKSAEEYERKLKATIDAAFQKTIENKIKERNRAREIKDWSKSDQIRDALAAIGIKIDDTKSGTVWSIDKSRIGQPLVKRPPDVIHTGTTTIALKAKRVHRNTKLERDSKTGEINVGQIKLRKRIRKKLTKKTAKKLKARRKK